MTATQWIFPAPLSPQAESACLSLAQALVLPPILTRLLWQRGIQQLPTAQHFMQAEADQLPSPFLLRDMHQAVERLDRAIERGEKILLYGDYDVDGTAAVALLYRFLRGRGATLDYYLPDRYREGYGLSSTGVAYARDTGVDLLICLDCGIKAHATIQEARDHGIDVIVCDHHLPDEQLPPALAVLDPKRPDCDYPHPDLCGTGVAFKLAQAYALAQGLPEAHTEHLLDLVLVATASDIVPLTGENRILARLGLRRLNEQPQPGLAALIRRSQRVPPLTVSDVVFGLGPMINAAGRLGDARDAVRLLLAPDVAAAAPLAQHLEAQNDTRKSVDRAMAEEAKALFLARADWEERASIVLFRPDWHKGVVGIVASRMVDWFQRPSVILTESEGQIVGSARSVRGFDLHGALGQCASHLSNYGGHRYAAGLTVKTGQLAAFQQDFERLVSETLDSTSRVATIELAGELDLSEVDFDFWRQLQRLAPFGPGHRQPIFYSKAVRSIGAVRLLKGQHLKFDIDRPGQSPLGAIAFGQGAHWAAVSQGTFDVCYTLRDNYWRGTHHLQLQVRDIRVEK